METAAAKPEEDRSCGHCPSGLGGAFVKKTLCGMLVEKLSSRSSVLLLDVKDHSCPNVIHIATHRITLNSYSKRIAYASSVSLLGMMMYCGAHSVFLISRCILLIFFPFLVPEYFAD